MGEATDAPEADEPATETVSADTVSEEAVEAGVLWEVADKARRANLKALHDITGVYLPTLFGWRSEDGEAKTVLMDKLSPSVREAHRRFMVKALEAMADIADSMIRVPQDDGKPFVFDVSRFGKDE